MTAAILLSIDPMLALATLLPFPFIAWLVHRVRDRLRHGFQQGNRAWAEMTSVLADTIPGIRVVKAFAQEQREVERFRQANDHVLHANDRVNAHLVVLRPDRRPADAARPAGGLGLRHLAGLPAAHHGRRADGVPAPTSAGSTSGWSR